MAIQKPAVIRYFNAKMLNDGEAIIPDYRLVIHREPPKLDYFLNHVTAVYDFQQIDFSHEKLEKFDLETVVQSNLHPSSYSIKTVNQSGQTFICKQCFFPRKLQDAICHCCLYNAPGIGKEAFMKDATGTVKELIEFPCQNPFKIPHHEENGNFNSVNWLECGYIGCRFGRARYILWPILAEIKYADPENYAGIDSLSVPGYKTGPFFYAAFNEGISSLIEDVLRRNDQSLPKERFLLSLNKEILEKLAKTCQQDEQFLRIFRNCRINSPAHTMLLTLLDKNFHDILPDSFWQPENLKRVFGERRVALEESLKYQATLKLKHPEIWGTLASP